MWTEMHRQFIEACARTLWAYAYAEERDRLIEAFNSSPGYYPDQTAEDYVERRGWPRSAQGVEWTEVAPPTPEYARLSAAMLLGRLEECNRCGLPVIVNAAKKADCGMIDPTKLCIDHDEDCPFDLAEFASDIAMMALGTGVSWFDDHEEFSLPTDQYYPKPQRTFTVPSIEFTYEQDEV